MFLAPVLPRKAAATPMIKTKYPNRDKELEIKTKRLWSQARPLSSPWEIVKDFLTTMNEWM